MMIFLSILGVIFIISIIGFLSSEQFKEYKRDLKSNPDSVYVNQATLQSNNPYYGDIRKIRTDGFYISRGDVVDMIFCYKPNARVLFTFDYSIPIESNEAYFLLAMNITSNLKTLDRALISKIIGNELLFSINQNNTSTKFVVKMKQNGQLEIHQTWYRENGEKVVEWADYNFVKFVE